MRRKKVSTSNIKNQDISAAIFSPVEIENLNSVTRHIFEGLGMPSTVASNNLYFINKDEFDQFVKTTPRNAKTQPTVPTTFQPSSEKKEVKKKTCPICHAIVLQLPRHMRDKHKFNRDDAKNIVNKTKQRKPYSRIYSERKHVKREYPLQQCPVEGCNKMLKRISDHLRYKHKNHEMKKQ